MPMPWEGNKFLFIYFYFLFLNFNNENVYFLLIVLECK